MAIKKIMFAQLQKIDATKRTVTGVMVSETPDAANEIFDYDASKAFFVDWSQHVSKSSGGKSLGNVRAMHQPISAGKLVDIQFDDEARKITCEAEIVDDGEWKKVEAGLYTGFSFGGKYVKKWKDPTDATKTRYSAKPHEVSLADLPCIPDATFDLTKIDGSTEAVKFATKEQSEFAAEEDRKSVV